MPQQFLAFPPVYCVVGAYRLVHDPALWQPIWARCKKSLIKTLKFYVLPWVIVAYPITRIYTALLAMSPLNPRSIHESRIPFLNMSYSKYTTYMLILTQVSVLIEYALAKELRKSKNEVYNMTVISRGKDAPFWVPYYEEWAEPPIDRAKRSLEKESFYVQLSKPFIRKIVLRIIVSPLSFIPFLGIIISSAIASLTMGKYLHREYFQLKKMTPFQQELWVVERQYGYRAFGFFAALIERLPLIGIVFGISNRIGAAMWAHDLEKRQHMFIDKTITPTERYESKTALIPPSDLPDDFSGGFPTKKSGQAQIPLEKIEKPVVPAVAAVEKPSLPERPLAQAPESAPIRAAASEKAVYEAHTLVDEKPSAVATATAAATDATTTATRRVPPPPLPKRS